MKLDAAQQFISPKDAMEVINQVGRQQGILLRDRAKLEVLIDQMPLNDEGDLRMDQLLGLLNNIEQALRFEDPEYIARNRGFKVDRVPDVQEVVESKEFANQRPTIWKSTLENLWWMHHGTPADLPKGIYRKTPEYDEPPCIICLSGAAGTGKSETTWLSAFYTLTLLFLMHNPHVELRHNPGRWIVLVCQGIREKTTKDSLFDSLQFAIDNSSWFEASCPRRKDYNEELQWPAQRIKVINLTGQFNSALGKDVLWAGVTEINEMPVIEKSKRVSNTAQTKLDVGESMWNTLENRIETRFSELGGGFPGKLIADSARTHSGDFTSKIRVKAQNDSRILLIERTVWGAQAHKYPASEPRFPVELGDDFKPPRILENVERAIDPERVVMVPERHRKRFEADCEKACTDFIGEPTRSIGRFIGYPEKITRAQELYVEAMGDYRPFKYDEFSIRDLFGELSLETPIDWQLLINYDYFDQILDKTTVFTTHTDMSATADATGFAFGRCLGSKEVGLAHVWNSDDKVVTEMTNIEAPVYQIDGILRVIARPGEIIDPAFFQALILELKRIGLNIKLSSADWFEANQMLLHLKKASILAEKWSLDKKPDGYFALKHAMREERLLMMPHRWNDHECRNLKQSVTRSKIQIQHPEPDGSKDCSDACAGVVGILDITVGRQYYREVKTEDPEDVFGESEIEEWGDPPRSGMYGMGSVMSSGMRSF